MSLGEGNSSVNGSGDRGAKCFTRSNASVAKIDWKSLCFICGELCRIKHRQTWSMVGSAITESSNMYTEHSEAAEARQDNDMLTRLRGVPNGDLVAVEARYHRQKSYHGHKIC